MASPSCNLRERGRRPGLRKMGSRWLVSTRSPCENPSHGSAAGRHGLWALVVGSLASPRHQNSVSARYLSDHPHWTNEETKARRGSFPQGQ